MVLALRRSQPGTSGLVSGELWADIEVTGIDDATCRSMAEPPELEHLCRASVAALVDHWLGLA